MSKTKTAKTIARARLEKVGYELYKGVWTKMIEQTYPVAAKDYPGVPKGTKHQKTSMRTIDDATGARYTMHWRKVV